MISVHYRTVQTPHHPPSPSLTILPLSPILPLPHYTPSPPVCQYSGVLNLTYYVRCAVSACGSFLVSGGSDNRALVWLTAQPGRPVAQLTGHHGEVTAVHWSCYGEEKVSGMAGLYLTYARSVTIGEVEMLLTEGTE